MCVSELRHTALRGQTFKLSVLLTIYFNALHLINLEFSISIIIFNFSGIPGVLSTWHRPCRPAFVISQSVSRE